MAVVETTKVRALREAKGLLQQFGFNGFSFQHVADALGIKKPSLYDHFKSKEVLGRQLVEEYYQSFKSWTETVEVMSPEDKIGALFEIFFKFSSNSLKICPTSAMIADYNSLPASIREPLSQMYEYQRKWLEKTIEDGQSAKVFTREHTKRHLADLVLSIAFGSQLIARVKEEPQMLRLMKKQALALLSA